MRLVICRTPAGLGALSRFPVDRPLTVASDDPRVQRAARERSGETTTCFIEQVESFYVVAEDVRRILEAIDVRLQALGPELPPELFSWGRNVEGGLTAQRVQDALLLTRSYQTLLAATQAREVHLIAEPHARWEDRVLVAVARAAGVPVHRTVVGPLAHWREQIRTGLRPCAVAFYYVASIIRLGGGGWRRPQIDSPDGVVAFQHVSALRKHIDNVAPLMQALQHRGRPTIALCWSASERYTSNAAPRQFADADLPAIEMERQVTGGDLVASSWLSARSAWRARRAGYRWRELRYRGIPLAPLLDESRRHFLIAELPQRIRYERALAAVLHQVRPAAFKPLGGPESFEGRAACRLLRSGSPALIFHYWLGISVDAARA